MKYYKIVWKTGSSDIFRGKSLSDIIIGKKLEASVINDIDFFESFELPEGVEVDAESIRHSMEVKGNLLLKGVAEQYMAKMYPDYGQR